MGATPRTARGRATRERILHAATSLVSERGVAGTSLDDVRERAHASKSQLYLYFPDRDALLREVAGSTCQLVIDKQSDVLARCDSLEGIERYLDAVVGLQLEREHPSGCPIASLAGQLADHDEQTRLILADGLGRWEDGLRSGLQAMAARGELRMDADPNLIATQILVLLQGGLLLTQVRRDAGQMRIAADTALQLVHDVLA
jgi:TetR/AcrR family transcriptional regulator, transcriptional repressor for nem operon